MTDLYALQITALELALKGNEDLHSAVIINRASDFLKFLQGDKTEQPSDTDDIIQKTDHE